MHKKLLIATALICSATPAFAFVSLITQGGQTTPMQGIVTAHSGITGEELFNNSTSPNSCAQQDQLGITILGGLGISYDISSDSVALRRRLPADDASCYLTLGSQNAAETIALEFPNSSASSPLVYLGFYWGSIDPYNSITFVDANGGHVPFFSNSGDFALAGDTAATMLGTPLYSSAFAEFSFAASDNVRQIVLTTSDYAFEIDNIAYTLQGTTSRSIASPAVLLASEPAINGLALVGAAMMIWARGRKGVSTVMA